MKQRAPVPCPEMVDIRDQIDTLDKKLVALLASANSSLRQRKGKTCAPDSAGRGAYRGSNPASIGRSAGAKSVNRDSRTGLAATHRKQHHSRIFRV